MMMRALLLAATFAAVAGKSCRTDEHCDSPDVCKFPEPEGQCMDKAMAISKGGECELRPNCCEHGLACQGGKRKRCKPIRGRCGTDCRLVKCALPKCEDNEELFTLESECCSICRPKKLDCSLVRCALPKCEGNEELLTPEFECCPICRPKKTDCSLVRCALPVCAGDEEIYQPEDECCPACRRTCPDCRNPLTDECDASVPCVADPCTINGGGCAAGQTCTANYCGGCHAICSGPVACTKDVKICPDDAAVGRDANSNCEFFPCPAGCPEDLKICPDGSSVVRDPKNDCEFFPCPPVLCATDVKQCPDGSYASRGGPDCEFRPCLQCEDCTNPVTGLCDATVACLGDPCSINACAGETCTPDYCGGCHAICQ